MSPDIVIGLLLTGVSAGYLVGVFHATYQRVRTEECRNARVQ